MSSKLLILNGGQRRDRTADAGLFRAGARRGWTICKDMLAIKKLKVEVSGSAKPLCSNVFGLALFT